jgi:pimeloyl-ACP methyl ester carboxylesterase
MTEAPAHGDLVTGSVHANGIEISYLEAGPKDAPLVLCLHGFPDSPWSWRHLLPALGDAGYHAVAPWLRGFAPTGVPGDGNYRRGALARDANALHEALSASGDAVLIGHDWGAFAVYGAAALAPERWHRVVALAVPPSATIAAQFLEYDQLRRSWYIYFFQSPLAELAVPANDLEFIDRLWADWSPGFDASEDLPRAKAAIRDPANLAAALAYYRQFFGGGTPDPDDGAADQPLTQPTLFLHGTQDGCLGCDLSIGVETHFGPGSARITVEGAGHFLHVEKPKDVIGPVLDWLSAPLES